MTHAPALFFSQFLRAASRAAALSLRLAAPACLPSSVVARAPHILGPSADTTRQRLAPQSRIAVCEASSDDCWFQLAPYLPAPRSQARAPYSAKAGVAGNNV